MKKRMKGYISAAQAARRYGVPIHRIYEAFNTGTIRQLVPGASSHRQMNQEDLDKHFGFRQPEPTQVVPPSPFGPFGPFGVTSQPTPSPFHAAPPPEPVHVTTNRSAPVVARKSQRAQAEFYANTFILPSQEIVSCKLEVMRAKSLGMKDLHLPTLSAVLKERGFSTVANQHRFEIGFGYALTLLARHPERYGPYRSSKARELFKTQYPNLDETLKTGVWVEATRDEKQLEMAFVPVADAIVNSDTVADRVWKEREPTRMPTLAFPLLPPGITAPDDVVSAIDLLIEVLTKWKEGHVATAE